MLFISRCYALKKQKEPAQEFLKKVEVMESHDEAIQEMILEVRQMVAKLK